MRKFIKPLLVISFLILSLLEISCAGDAKDLLLTTEIKLINNTDKIISMAYIVDEDTVDLFQILPFTEYVDKVTTEAGDNVSLLEAGEDALMRVWDFAPTIPLLISYNGEKCSIVENNEGPRNISNFESVKLSKRHFQYSYQFSDEHYDEADSCE